MEAVKELRVEVKEPSLQDLREEIRTLQSEIHLLQRQQSSRRGEPGQKGDPGKDSIVPGPKGDPGTVSKAQAMAMFREIMNEPEIAAALGEVAVKEFKKRILAYSEGRTERI